MPRTELSLVDIIFPIISWGILLIYSIYRYYRAHNQYYNISLNDNVINNPNFKYYPLFFYQMREGWVRKNFLTGQSTANSTRDYIRVLVFYIGNSGVMLMIFVGYATHYYDSKYVNIYNDYFSIKLGVTALIFLISFYLFIYSMRYALQLQ